MDPLDSTAVVELHARRRASFDLDRTRELLSQPEQAWLGMPDQNGSDGTAFRSYHADLRLPLQAGSHQVALPKAAIVELGPIDRVDGSLVVGISWRSAQPDDPLRSTLFYGGLGIAVLSLGVLVLVIVARRSTDPLLR